jgi:hypothetical protein
MTMTGAYPKSCEFFVKSLRKPDQVLVEKCSLTGRNCFCEGESFHTCTRRTFALTYEERHQSHIGGKVKVVCSEDTPKPPLPCS